MAHIIIYTKPTCPYCARAKALFDSKGQVYDEINIAGDEVLRAEMIEKADGAYTVPQVFIQGKHIGGCDDLYACEEAGELDGLFT